MPSPFPGMDPYLEESAQWPGVHQRLITYAADAMQPTLRPRYHVLIGERVYIAEPPQKFYPDLTLVQYPAQRESAGGSVAVAEADAPTVVGGSLEEGQRQPFIEIVHIGSGTVVTVMEILSPSNKIGVGRQEYLRKQQQLLSSGSHLVEIDLLRAGEHTVACPVSVFRYAIPTLISYWIYKLFSSAVTTMGGMRISLTTAVPPHRRWHSTTRSGRSYG